MRIWRSGRHEICSAGSLPAGLGAWGRQPPSSSPIEPSWEPCLALTRAWSLDSCCNPQDLLSLVAWWWFLLSTGPVPLSSPRSCWRGCIACWQLSLCLFWWLLLVSSPALQSSHFSESWWSAWSLPLRVCCSWRAVLSLLMGCLVVSQGWGDSAVPWSVLPIVSAVPWLLSVGSCSCPSLACLSAGICPSASWSPGTGPSDSQGNCCLCLSSYVIDIVQFPYSSGL